MVPCSSPIKMLFACLVRICVCASCFLNINCVICRAIMPAAVPAIWFVKYHNRGAIIRENHIFCSEAGNSTIMRKHECGINK